MDSYAHFLSPPTGPLKRQVGVCIDGFPLSPISISRSISNGSHESVETHDEKTKKYLQRFSHVLTMRITHLQDEIVAIKMALKEHPKPQGQKLLLDRKAEKEQAFVLTQKKLKKVHALLDVFNEE